MSAREPIPAKPGASIGSPGAVVTKIWVLTIELNVLWKSGNHS